MTDLSHDRHVDFDVVLYNLNFPFPFDNWTPGVGEHMFGKNSRTRMNMLFIGFARSGANKLNA